MASDEIDPKSRLDQSRRDPTSDIKTVSRRLYLTQELDDAIKAHAQAEGWPFSDTAEYFLRFALKAHANNPTGGDSALLKSTLRNLRQLKRSR